MSQYIELPSTTLLDTQTALEYYNTTFETTIQNTLNILAGTRELLFTPTLDWFDTLTQAVQSTLPPTVSHNLLDTAKWDTIDEFVPSTVKDSRQKRLDATIKVITSFIDAFAEAHHNATPDPIPDDQQNRSLDEWTNTS